MNKLTSPLALLCLFCAFFISLSDLVASETLLQSKLNLMAEEQGFTTEDVTDWIISDQYISAHNQVEHIYIRQRYQGIEVFNAVANFNIKDGQVLSMNQDFVSNLNQKINATEAVISPIEAIESAASSLGLGSPVKLQIAEQISQQQFVFNKGGISQEPIPVRAMYQPLHDGLVRLAWDLSILTLDGEDWWSVRIDAVNGDLLHKNNWIVHCSFASCPGETTPHQHKAGSAATKTSNANNTINTAKQAPDSYNVFAIPTESPNHGPRTLVVDPADPIASPFGWHDTDGTAGAEYTITRGNNVYASEDASDLNVPGFSPDGGPSLDFDFPLNLNQSPGNYQDVAVTNLFYMNNIMHDVFYQYGFTEESGNFQENNYGNGGLGTDYVNADAQDGGGTNNANFGTPPDGSNPRMQMFLWTTGGGLVNLLTINSPAGISGAYTAAEAGFGPGVPPVAITANLVLVDDGTLPNPNDGCEPITNGNNLIGNIAVIDRGDCTFVTKVQAAQDEGAVAVIIINNVGGTPISMGGASTTITIPSIMVSEADGNLIKSSLITGIPVNGSIQNLSGTVNFDIDGDFDNGIIAHEYGHGISNRLTGGPNNTGCLSNAEQMGEGWSDYFGIILTMEPGDAGADIRGVGTFATNEPTNGNGIRPAPYSTDFGINPYTYASTNNTGIISQPHGIGFIWCTMLWDMTWALIDVYGWDPDVYNGNGGNNIAIQLVMDGMKLQSCNPGFVDGRDAILEADVINYGGAHRCLIWEVFANRGLGFSAEQGSSGSRSDQVEAFDLPTFCQTAVVAPNANFSTSAIATCDGFISFEDASTDIPQSWHWDFGDGDTSNLINPTHTYTSDGVYTVTLTVTNNIGSDVSTTTITVTTPPAPTVADGSGCEDDSVQLTASGTGEIRWFDDNGNQVAVGNTFWTPPLGQNATYQAQNVERFPSVQAGPADNSFGGGGYHGSGFTGTVNFTAQVPLDIISAWVDAEYAGPRDFFLWDGPDASGSILQQVTVDIPFSGAGRIDLGFEVPASGDFSIGGTGVDMYRNNSGANYPYDQPGLITVTGSSAGTDFYYYLYDLEVEQAPCKSAPVPVEAIVVVPDFTFSLNDKVISILDNSTGAVNWSWTFGDGESSTLQNPVHVFENNGVYTITLEINNTGCFFTQQIVVGAVGIEDIIEPDISLYPNPTKDQIFIDVDGLTEELELEVYSVDGKLIQSNRVSANANQTIVDLSDFSDGIYLVKIKSGSFSIIERIVLQR